LQLYLSNKFDKEHMLKTLLHGVENTEVVKIRYSFIAFQGALLKIIMLPTIAPLKSLKHDSLAIQNLDDINKQEKVLSKRFTF
jgi:hypothetical protein